jgi:hypothetical protein
MKKLVFQNNRIILFILTFIIFIFVSHAQSIHFKKMNCIKDSFNLSNLNISCISILEKNKFIIIAMPKKSTDDYFADKMIIFDSIHNEIIFESSSREIYYGYNLYTASLKNGQLILWEIENEYASYLELYYYVNKQFTHIGDFDIALNPSKNNKENLSYPVKEIEISEKEGYIQFKFLKKLILHPYSGNSKSSKTENMLTYQLDKLTKTLKIK